MVKTLEQLKKDKNYLAHVKGYPIDPEGFPEWFLRKRLNDEYEEFIGAVNCGSNDDIIDELADMSNIIDYIATKIITGYPNKYTMGDKG